jgi:O-acetyl-ADP-ribose deacetylase (regulator of RNase III)
VTALTGVQREYLTSHQHNIAIAAEDLLSSSEQQVDVLVYEINQQMNFSKSSLEKKLGPQLTKHVEQECKSFVQKNGSLQAGKIHFVKLSTPSFCKYVCFVGKLTWFGGKKGEEMKIKDCVHNVLETAHKLNLISVALPPLGLQNGHPRDRLANVMWKTVKEWASFRKQNTPIKHIRFTILPNDKECVQQFVQVYESLIQHGDMQSPVTPGKGKDTFGTSPDDDLLNDLAAEDDTSPTNSTNKQQQRQPRKLLKRKHSVHNNSAEDPLAKRSKFTEDTSPAAAANLMSLATMPDDAMQLTLQADSMTTIDPPSTSNAAAGVINMSLAEDDLWRK